MTDSVVGLAVNFSFPKAAKSDPTPPSRLRRLSDRRSPGEGEIWGLDTDSVARRVFAAASFSTTDCEVDGQSYIGVTDERVRGALIRLFGPRLSTLQLEQNMSVLERAKWGWVEGMDSTVISLERDIAHQRVSELCVLALSSLSPVIVKTVTQVLTTLADSLQREKASLTRHMAEVNLYVRVQDSQLILVNSRLDVAQRRASGQVRLRDRERVRSGACNIDPDVS